MLSAGEVHQSLSLTAITLAGVKGSPAVVAPNRLGSFGSSFTTFGDAIELRPQQQAIATFSLTVPDCAPQPWLIIHVAQVSRGSIVGGYTIAAGTG
jgi:hypothetical protein